jgi:hypothetical protein
MYFKIIFNHSKLGNKKIPLIIATYGCMMLRWHAMWQQG